MRRWRTVALLGKPTSDGRELRGAARVRTHLGHERAGVVPLLYVGRVSRGHEGAVPIGEVDVLCQDDRVLAYLPWRLRRASISTDPSRVEHYGWAPTPSDTTGPTLIACYNPLVTSVCVGPPNAWPELRLEQGR